jgi:hypothetical protein
MPKRHESFLSMLGLGVKEDQCKGQTDREKDWGR